MRNGKFQNDLKYAKATVRLFLQPLASFLFTPIRASFPLPSFPSDERAWIFDLPAKEKTLLQSNSLPAILAWSYTRNLSTKLTI